MLIKELVVELFKVFVKSKKKDGEKICDHEQKDVQGKKDCESK